MFTHDLLLHTLGTHKVKKVPIFGEKRRGVARKGEERRGSLLPKSRKVEVEIIRLTLAQILSRKGQRSQERARKGKKRRGKSSEIQLPQTEYRLCVSKISSTHLTLLLYC